LVLLILIPVMGLFNLVKVKTILITIIAACTMYIYIVVGTHV
jgi:hypothetical protein